MLKWKTLAATKMNRRKIAVQTPPMYRPLILAPRTLNNQWVSMPAKKRGNWDYLVRLPSWRPAPEENSGSDRSTNRVSKSKSEQKRDTKTTKDRRKKYPTKIAFLDCCWLYMEAFMTISGLPQLLAAKKVNVQPKNTQMKFTGFGREGTNFQLIP